MALHFQFQTLTLTLTLLTIFLSKATICESKTTFYSILESNSLPIGLFPKGITDFSISPKTGEFELHLLSLSPCDTEFETRVRYQWNITGIVSYGSISNLSGVAAQELFLWLPVNGIRVDLPSSGLIYFDVGVLRKQFSLSFFEIPKDCSNVGVVEDGMNRAEKLVRERVTDEDRAIS